jgi:ParB-like chromosome segregation protein Spo0J
MKDIISIIESQILPKINEMQLSEKVDAINEIKKLLHLVSPFNSQPVDCVLWVKNTSVFANDYNPNVVAPVEMELLAHSIKSDGYTQPIVTAKLIDIGKEFNDENREVIDGFHRTFTGKNNKDIQEMVHGYLPVVTAKGERLDKNDRMASTVRHNRARGKHQVNSMSDMVVELKRRNWSDEKIAKELGMESDEVLRLSQISGLAEMFLDREFSIAFEVTHE